MKIRPSERGQVLLEFLAVSVFTVSFLAGTFCVLVFAYTKTSLRHIGYESAVCIMEGSAPTTCRVLLQKKARLLFPSARFEILKLSGNHRSSKAELRLTWFENWTFHENIEAALPG